MRLIRPRLYANTREHLRQLLDACRAVDRTDRLCWKARGHNWDVAYASLQPQLRAVAQHARACADAHLRSAGWDGQEASAPVLSPQNLVDELRSLGAEFDKVHVDLRRGVLSADTAPVTLDGVQLGRFRMELHLPLLGQLPLSVSDFALVKSWGRSQQLARTRQPRSFCPRALSSRRLAQLCDVPHWRLDAHNGW